MADKQRIRAHLAQSATIKLEGISQPTQGEEAKKRRMMEHVAKSLGKR